MLDLKLTLSGLSFLSTGITSVNLFFCSLEGEGSSQLLLMGKTGGGERSLTEYKLRYVELTDNIGNAFFLAF